MLKKKFGPAFSGLKNAIKDPSIVIQCALGLLAVIAGILFNLTRQEWEIIILCIFLVIVSEVFNTCIERVCDLYTNEENQKVRWIKDVSAAAVLLSAFAALIEAALIFGNYIF